MLLLQTFLFTIPIQLYKLAMCPELGQCNTPTIFIKRIDIFVLCNAIGCSYELTNTVLTGMPHLHKYLGLACPVHLLGVVAYPSVSEAAPQHLCQRFLQKDWYLF